MNDCTGLPHEPPLSLQPMDQNVNLASVTFSIFESSTNVFFGSFSTSFSTGITPWLVSVLISSFLFVSLYYAQRLSRPALRGGNARM